MKILIVGRTCVFDTLAVAWGCLNQNDIRNCPHFGDIELEIDKRLLAVGTGESGNEFMSVGFKVPEIILIINQELESMSNINPEDRWQVLPVSIKGENTTRILSWLAAAPIFGAFFLEWAKRRTLSRSAYLLQLGKNLLQDNISSVTRRTDSIIAAKPHRNH
jgi:hypothetical protein